MKIKKILSFILLLPILLVGCSSNSVSSDDINNLTNSISFPNLEKVEYDSNNKKLIFYTKDEFISKDDVNEIIENISLNKKTGLQALTKDNFNNVANSLEIISANKNSANINFDNLSDIYLNISNNTYSENYLNFKFKEISAYIVNFNSLAGKIETSLKQNNFKQELVQDFNNNFIKLNAKIDRVAKIINESDNSSNFETKVAMLDKVKQYSSSVKSGVDSAAATKDFNSINNNFLNINELDKIARELQK